MKIVRSKRELIIDGAIKVFAREGFHKAKVEDIADVAGVGKGTIYEYFESKKHLFQETLAFSLEIYVSNIESVLQKQQTTEEKLRNFFLLIIGFTQQHLDILKVFSQEMWRHEEEIMSLMIETKDRVITMVETILADAIKEEEFRVIDTKTASISFLGGINYMVMYHICIAQDRITEEIIDSYISLFINGLKNHP
ncbi:TetR/AcrR family transcriptional regulator [Natronincola ferrireducens]|uniref:Transcriptional regulator, TetR family n=1 Tax=Natronincola ferrireducens TaxID=393762 RepID=A0A1G9FF82_9FIRM|nr:TetR/AcrR family transcriptional regulator [Natronincola ferrireducens]SDK86997.1 transcriptional regulator, TetR family [Natronincola ferrireducens]